jgi:UDP-N-acetylmuramoyl-tripeptide--D-alanyl-D-alanine ligase
MNRKTFGGSNSDVNATYSVNEEGCVVIELQTESGKFLFPTHLFGGYNYNNVLAAISIGLHFGISLDNIKKALDSYHPQNNRSQILKTENNLIILDAYNANPTSMELAINSFAELQNPNKMLVLGDMLELGNNSAEEHQAVVSQIENLGIKEVFLIGAEFCETQNNFRTFQDIDVFSTYIRSHSPKGYSILMKGSRGIGIEKTLDLLT